MTNQSVWFVCKILVGSVLLAVLIKYGFGSIEIAIANGIALTMVLLPAGVLAISLAWRALRTQISAII